MALCPDDVPVDVLQFIRQHFQANATRAHLLTQELIALVHAAADRGLTLIPFKGPTLAVMAYGNLLLRDFRDMDLIFAQQDLLDVYEVFMEKGYDNLHEILPSYHNDQYSQPYHHFVKAHGQVRVDLQSVMADGDFSFQLDRESILQNLQPISIYDSQVSCLRTEELLLILCIHGSKHVWEELKWVCDVAELISSQEDIDWGRMLRLAHEWRCVRMVFLGFSLAQSLFECTIPEFLKERINSDREVNIMTQNISRSLSDPAHSIHGSEYQAYYYWLKDRQMDRWSYGMHLCRTESPLLTHSIPWFHSQGSLIWLNWVLSPVKLVVEKLKSKFQFNNKTEKIPRKI